MWKKVIQKISSHKQTAAVHYLMGGNKELGALNFKHTVHATWIPALKPARPFTHSNLVSRRKQDSSRAITERQIASAGAGRADCSGLIKMERSAYGPRCFAIPLQSRRAPFAISRTLAMINTGKQKQTGGSEERHQQCEMGGGNAPKKCLRALRDLKTWRYKEATYYHLHWPPFSHNSPRERRSALGRLATSKLIGFIDSGSGETNVCWAVRVQAFRHSIFLNIFLSQPVPW